MSERVYLLAFEVCGVHIENVYRHIRVITMYQKSYIGKGYPLPRLVNRGFMVIAKIQRNGAIIFDANP